MKEVSPELQQKLDRFRERIAKMDDRDKPAAALWGLYFITQDVQARILSIEGKTAKDEEGLEAIHGALEGIGRLLAKLAEVIGLGQPKEKIKADSWGRNKEVA